MAQEKTAVASWELRALVALLPFHNGDKTSVHHNITPDVVNNPLLAI